ncbi:MAG: hypothetical protein GC185_13500 [Alphaproteobacteria bacterium]|nr:hypothetical protein [Alphaproteobacteria bacterium]
MAFNIPNPLKMVKKQWDKLSVTSKDSLKSALKWGVVVTGLGLLLTGWPVVTLLQAGAIWTAGHMAINVVGKRMYKEMQQEGIQEVWKNDIGQVVQATNYQQRDLKAAQKAIDKVVNGHSQLSMRQQKKIMGIMRHFNGVAEKAIILQDIEGNDGHYRHALKTDQVQVQKTIQAL